MQFKSKTNEQMWNNYRKSQAVIKENFHESEFDEIQGDGDVSGEVSVMTFEPEMEVEVEEQSDGCNEVIYSDIKKLAEYSNRILKICQHSELEPWMQAKLVKASDYVSDVWHRLDAEADFANTGFEQSDNIGL